MSYEIIRGDALDLIQQEQGSFDLIVTDPPYSFGGSGSEHAVSATVAVVLREAARRLRRGRWMVVMCASSWRSVSYVVESVRGLVEPVRIATWCKPECRSKVVTPGWSWASVSVVALRRGKSELPVLDCQVLDHVTAPVVRDGRRAELPPVVAAWAVRPFAVPGRFLDPFAGSGALVRAAHECGMDAVGYEKKKEVASSDELKAE